MKLMDEVAGIVAARHCKTNIVTASVDAINFHDKIRKGKAATGVPAGCVPGSHRAAGPAPAHPPHSVRGGQLRAQGSPRRLFGR